MFYCTTESKSFSKATMSSNVDHHQHDELECPHCKMPKAEDRYDTCHIAVPYPFVSIISDLEGKIRRKNKEILMWREESD